MGTIDKSMFESLRGKIGDLVFYKHLGKTCVRTLPTHKAPMGTGALAQQERIAAVAIFYKAACAAGLGEYWKNAEKPQNWSGYNLFIKTNLPAFTGDGVIGDFPKLYLTAGVLQLPDSIQLKQHNDNSWLLTWNNTTLYPTCNPNDRIRVALMKCEECFDIRIPNIPFAKRCDGQLQFRIPKEWENYTHLFVYVSSEQGELISPSFYINYLNL